MSNTWQWKIYVLQNNNILPRKWAGPDRYILRRRTKNSVTYLCISGTLQAPRDHWGQRNFCPHTVASFLPKKILISKFFVRIKLREYFPTLYILRSNFITISTFFLFEFYYMTKILFFASQDRIVRFFISFNINAPNFRGQFNTIKNYNSLIPRIRHIWN